MSFRSGTRRPQLPSNLNDNEALPVPQEGAAISRASLEPSLRSSARSSRSIATSQSQTSIPTLDLGALESAVDADLVECTKVYESKIDKQMKIAYHWRYEISLYTDATVSVTVLIGVSTRPCLPRRPMPWRASLFTLRSLTLRSSDSATHQRLERGLRLSKPNFMSYAEKSLPFSECQCVFKSMRS